MTKDNIVQLAQRGNPVLSDQNSGRIANQARKRLGLPHADMASCAALAAAILSQKPPENRIQQLEMLRLFVLRFPTKASAQEAIMLARMAGGYEAPPSKGEKARQKRRARRAFYSSRSWLVLRMEVLRERGPKCECCGATANDARIHVDHIKPRSLYPELALEKSNLQVLCEPCNRGKGAWDETNWSQK